jgi:hypothetical protein
MKVQTDHYLLNAMGDPVPCPDVLVWAQWFEVADRHLCDTKIGDVRISTVFLGLDHNFGLYGQPILWETLVFGGRFDGEMYRYHTRLEATRGHEEMCDRVRKETR